MRQLKRRKIKYTKNICSICGDEEKLLRPFVQYFGDYSNCGRGKAGVCSIFGDGSSHRPEQGRIVVAFNHCLQGKPEGRLTPAVVLVVVVVCGGSTYGSGGLWWW